MKTNLKGTSAESPEQIFGADELQSWSQQSRYSRFCEIVSSGFFVTMILSILAGIVFRQFDFGFSRAMQWSFAMASISLIWTMFIGTGLIDKEKSHIRVDFFYEQLSLRSQTIINMVGNVLFATTFALVIPGAIRFADAAGSRSLVGSPITYTEVFSIFVFWFAVTAMNQVIEFFQNWQILAKSGAKGARAL